MADANQDLFDASLRHQIGVRRFAAGEVNRALDILEAADRELVRRLRQHLRRMEGQTTTRGDRYKALIKDVRTLRLEVMTTYAQYVRQQMLDFGKSEADFERRMMQSALPFEFAFAAVPADTIRALVTATPFAGGANAARTLQQWFDGLAASDQRRTIDAINMGITQQESVDDIVRRVVGTRARRYQDGALSVTRRQAEAVVRTAVNHVSNAAREAMWQENKDIIRAMKWNATLDGRTSTICAARDGHFAPVSGEDMEGVPEPRLDPPTARPPAHPNCRSIMVAVLDDEGVAATLGERPFVRDARTRRMREKDFRADARASVGEEQWRRLSESQRLALIRDQRSAWAQANIGQVPSDVDYDTWLRRQPTDFQNQVLGRGKAQAFRNGLRLDKFVDRRGNELTLAELKALEPEFF